MVVISEADMDAEEFISGIETAVKDATIHGLLQLLRQPPGRNPQKEKVRLSEWYNKLDEQSKDAVKLIIESATDMAIFNLLCVIDGVIAVEKTTEKGSLQLWYIGKDKKLLNAEDSPMLHDLYSANA